MGAIISRWRKKATNVERLEKIETDIASIEALKQGNQNKQRRIIGSLLLYSVVTYFTAAIIFYLYCMPESRRDKILYSMPLLVFPFLVYLLKRFLHWYFVKRITKNEIALDELLKEKSKILDTVMETETYKVAKEILDKFDPDRNKSNQNPESTPPPTRARDGQELRQRKPGGTPPPQRAGVAQTPGAAVTETPAGRPLNITMPTTSSHNGQPRPPVRGPPMPRPILPRERGTTERLLEMLIGDGPQNRYALICSECHSHNGMALREEFEFLSFRCCYCYHMNASRKQKPRAPRLNFSPRGSIDRSHLRANLADRKVKCDQSDESDASESKPEKPKDEAKSRETD